MRPDDYTLGQFAALDQPAWQAPPQRLEEWPGAERPSATNWMMGETAALGDYIPTPPSNILGDIAQGVVDYAKRPGQTMAANPYPPASEEAQFFEDQRRSNTYRVAPEAAMDLVGGGTPFAVKGGLGMAGGKMITPTAPGALAATSEYRPPFYSAVEQAVQGAKQNAAPGQQWAGFLRNQPGVKPEEIEALKLGKLFEQPGSVPKEAVLGEIAANRVNVGEVMKGGRPKAVADFENFKREIELRHNTHLDSPYDVAKWAGSEAADRYEMLLRAAQDAQRQTGPTKFQQYTLPGGENYREMLLTLPDKGTPSDWKVVPHPSGTGYAIRNSRGEYGLSPDGRRDAVFSSEYNARSAIADYAPTQSMRDEFKSSHYDEPNILAHVRYNDRVIDGKKTLFVEEVQSDWHQAGKKRGYKEGEPQTIPSFTADQLKIHETEHQYVGTTPDGRQQVVGKGTVGDEDGAREYLTRYMNKMAAERNMSAVQAHHAKVPDAPFKTTWPELAMKRIIREAAEKGYDKVAWTPGSVQAARYDLSKHVDGIQVSGRTDVRTGEQSHGALVRMRNGQDLSVGYGKDGIIDNTGASNTEWKGKHLSDVFGKDIAEKMVNGKSVFDADLKIGGEGMKGFYDEILPATVNKLVKKHGGRVTQGEMVSGDLSKFDIEPAGGGWRIVDRAANEGQGQFVGGVFRSGADAEKYLADKGHTNKNVHTLDITPSLRAAAMKGFPLFTAGGVAATGAIGELARQDEYR